MKNGWQDNIKSVIQDGKNVFNEGKKKINDELKRMKEEDKIKAEKKASELNQKADKLKIQLMEEELRKQKEERKLIESKAANQKTLLRVKIACFIGVAIWACWFITDFVHNYDTWIDNYHKWSIGYEAQAPARAAARAKYEKEQAEEDRIAKEQRLEEERIAIAAEQLQKREAFERAERERVLAESKTLKGRFFNVVAKTANLIDQKMTIHDAKEYVKSGLVDPGSAEFKNTKTYMHSSGRKVVCGEVNAKNGFGGYAGDSSFIINGPISDGIKYDPSASEISQWCTGE